MNKKSALIIALGIILPFVADHMGWWAAVLGTGQLSTIVLTVYTLALIAIVVTLLVKKPVLVKREKWIWAVCLYVRVKCYPVCPRPGVAGRDIRPQRNLRFRPKADLQSWAKYGVNYPIALSRNPG